MMGVCESSADRITDLPADVIRRIFVLLPIKAAARTSVLSRNWRHRWRSIPQLVFKDDFANFGDEAKSEWEGLSKQVLLNILECLLHHDGPITNFELSIIGLVSSREIDLVTLYLAKKGLQHFTLQFPCDSAGIYRVHSSLFSALHLKSLSLMSCSLTPPSWFVGFRKLIDLQLYGVELPSDFFDKFLPKCPMLESLCVIQCGGAAGKLQIVAPFLKSFEFWGDIDICFKYTPLLSEVSVNFIGGSIPDMVSDKTDLVSLFASLPGLQKFSANHEILKYLAAGDRNVPTRLPTPLHLLEVLKMNDLIFDGSRMERVFLCLIRSAPNMRSLTVSGSQLDVQPPSGEVTSIRRLLEAEVRPGSSDCLQHLREFRIKYSCGTQAELDLARFVLATAPLLQLVCVSPTYKLGAKEVAELMKELRSYKPVSQEAEITCDGKYSEV